MIPMEIDAGVLALLKAKGRQVLTVDVRQSGGG